MKTISDHYNFLLISGVWSGPANHLKKNCDKCYNRRHLGKYTTCIEMKEDKENNRLIKVPIPPHYIPCKCLTKKIKLMLEEEKKKTILSISESDLSNIENIGNE